jgi:2-keto-4-pentenoate hydratase/2-oxohepta-3-ene-1,7-dioic acid hydratase in catechol pathway
MVMTAVSVDHGKWDSDHAVFEAGMYESFAPSGPWLVTKDEVAGLADLRIEMRVNGAVRQQLLAGEMRWSANRLVSLLSRMTLQAGDIIFTGGVDPWAASAVVRVGDVVEGSVDGLGAIRNRVVH